MQLEVVGPRPLSCDTQGQLLTRIGTIFPQHNALYTAAPGVHAWQRLNFIDSVNARRSAEARPPLSAQEEQDIALNSVDLIFEPGHILIRPDPERMELAFAADDLLQTIVSKRQVRFLSVSDPRVREAIKRRGEYWRMSFIPKDRAGKEQLLLGSKVGIHGPPIYFYNRLTGTRWLTYAAFERLGQLDPAALGRHLQEIADHAHRQNRLGRPELDFFAAEPERLSGREFAGKQYDQLPPEELQREFARLRTAFSEAVKEVFRHDDPLNKTWSEKMVSTLFLEGNEAETEQLLSGLSPEFFLQIEWLAGGRFDGGEFLLDSLFDEALSHPEVAELQRLCDARAKDIVFNFIRDYGDLEYINLGRVPESLSLDRPQKEGRRSVFLAEFKAYGEPEPLRRFLRLQKWGVWEHLDEGKGLLQSIQESDEYTDYWLDRRLGCRQLGMNLCRRFFMRRLTEVYRGKNDLFRGQQIRSTYFEREYLSGIATDKLPQDRYARGGYSLKLASLIGKAAASSIIVGRSFDEARPAFDDGDEIVFESEQGLPAEVLVGDHSGAFTEYKKPLTTFASDYARPVNVRESLVPDPRAFADAYLSAFQAQFLHTQAEYRGRRRAFDTLFKHCRYDTGGSFAYRWECVLKRLDQTDPEALLQAIRAHIRVLNPKA